MNNMTGNPHLSSSWIWGEKICYLCVFIIEREREREGEGGGRDFNKVGMGSCNLTLLTWTSEDSHACGL